MTNSCFEFRDELMKKLIVFGKLKSVNEICLLTFPCLFRDLFKRNFNRHLCLNLPSVESICDDLILLPGSEFIYSHMFFLLRKDLILSNNGHFGPPEYICDHG